MAGDGTPGPVIVLVEPQLGENIGMAARAMLNCRLTELRLVKPRDGWPSDEATAAAAGAVEVVEGARVFDTTADAVADLERRHLDAFNKLIPERRVRPTALLPLWHVAGFTLGAGTALLGEKAAHACTVAVEEVIDEHYTGQIARLDAEGGEKKFRDRLEEFRLEEVEHKQTSLDLGAREAPGYEALTGPIRAGLRLAIWLSTRI